jgi:hypothetical protein
VQLAAAQPIPRRARHRSAVRDVRNPNGGAHKQCQRTSVSVGIADAVLLVQDCGARSERVIDRARTLMAGCDADRRSRAGSAEVH